VGKGSQVPGSPDGTLGRHIGGYPFFNMPQNAVKGIFGNPGKPLGQGM
jgi:hypothetical protein